MDARSEHPDEGTIHAWLDGALDDANARALAAHVASCRSCAERVAEARGLIAGASRIVGALDDVPTTGSAPWGQVAAGAPVTSRAASAWRWLRVTPARAAMAATILVAIGVGLTYERAAVDSDASRVAMSPAREMATSATPPAERPPDALLDSAVARNLAKAQPPRAVGPAPGPAIPIPEVASGNAAAVADRSAPTRVAVGRAAVQAQRESTAGVTADQLAAKAPGVPVTARREQTVAAAVRADSVAGAASGSMVAAAPAPAAAAAQSRVLLRAAPTRDECYRVESANGSPATWGVVALPFTVAVDVAAGRARVLDAAGQSTSTTAVATRTADDSLLLRLRHIGYEGTLTLGAAGDARAGVMRSRPTEARLEAMVVTGAAADSPAERSRAQRAARANAPAAKAAPSTTELNAGLGAAPAVPVVARKSACTG